MYLSPVVAYIIDVIGKMLSALSYLFMKVAHTKIEQ